MELKDIEAVLMESLDKPDNEELKNKYAELITVFLKTNKSSDGLVSIVVRGMDIDRGSNYLDYVASVSKGDIPSIWKQIRENKEVANNRRFLEWVI